MMALPAWWLGHLVLLGRPIASGVSSGNGAAPPAPALEWYPVGRILLWIAGFAVLSTMATLLTLGTDAATITETLRAGLLRVLSPRTAAPNDEIMQRIDAMVMIAPAAAVSSAMTMLMLNLWLAARITATSGRLHRPWPDLKTYRTAADDARGIVGGHRVLFLRRAACDAGSAVAAALLMAYALTGFAVLHTTLGLKGRALWLGCTYAIVLVSGGWLIPAMMAVGLADAVFGFRRRFLMRRPPPLPVS